MQSSFTLYVCIQFGLYLQWTKSLSASSAIFIFKVNWPNTKRNDWSGIRRKDWHAKEVISISNSAAQPAKICKFSFPRSPISNSGKIMALPFSGFLHLWFCFFLHFLFLYLRLFWKTLHSFHVQPSLLKWRCSGRDQGTDHREKQQKHPFCEKPSWWLTKRSCCEASLRSRMAFPTFPLPTQLNTELIFCFWFQIVQSFGCAFYWQWKEKVKP